MSPYLRLDKVSKTYGGGLFRSQSTVALRDSTISIGGDQPTIISVAGESGSGKTTMGMLLLGFIRPTSGRVLYRGEDLWQASRPTWRDFRREVQAIFQDPFEVYNPFYKVDHVMTMPIAKFGLAKSRDEQQEMMEQALREVGLHPREVLGRYPHQLSGGQRQRITVARALTLKPKVIIADEPVSMVDASLRATILKSLRNLREKLGISILYITHDLTTAYHVSDNILILYLGNVVEAGEVESVIVQPKHPYTQLLVGSIAWPDPAKRWGAAEQVGSSRMERVAQGCAFAPRCPQVMQSCRQNMPPLFKTDSSRTVACFLYHDAPELENQRIESIMTQPSIES